jgi:hypothetical protein
VEVGATTSSIVYASFFSAKEEFVRFVLRLETTSIDPLRDLVYGGICDPV